MKIDLKNMLPLAALIVAAILIFRKKNKKDNKMQLSKNITLAQGIRSATAKARGIDNTPTDAIIENMKITAQNVYEPLLKKIPSLIVTSFYRSPALNKAIGGSPTSQHMKGQAMDLSSNDNLKLFEAAKSLPNFDQIIWEFGASKPAWVHVSFSPTRSRREILKAVKNSKGGTTYEHI